MARLIGALAILTLLFACQSPQVEEEKPNPFVGDWKLDQDQSNLTGDVITFEETDSGMIRATVGTESWEFKIDGNEYPGAFGEGTVSWKELGERKWEMTFRLDGKVMSTMTRELSEDGQTMSWVQEGTKPNGESFRDSGSDKRVGGTEGLLGKWQSTEVKVGSPELVQITALGEEGITIAQPGYQLTCDGRFDGTPGECRGPTVPEGLTMSLQQLGPNELSYSLSIKSRDWSSGKMIVSENGQFLTMDSQLVGTDQTTTAIYQKQ